jgi:hypothetical protein
MVSRSEAEAIFDLKIREGKTYSIIDVPYLIKKRKLN